MLPVRLLRRWRQPPAVAGPLDQVGQLQGGQDPQHLEDVAAGDGRQPLGLTPTRTGQASSTRTATSQSPSRGGRRPVGRSARSRADAADRLDDVRRRGDQRRPPASWSRSSSWQPTDMAEVTGPGTTMTCLPSFRARLAVAVRPERAAASTTTVPRVEAGDQPVAHEEPVLVRGGSPAATR